jgi:hypothetical protein
VWWQRRRGRQRIFNGLAESRRLARVAAAQGGAAEADQAEYLAMGLRFGGLLLAERLCPGLGLRLAGLLRQRLFARIDGGLFVGRLLLRQSFRLERACPGLFGRMLRGDARQLALMGRDDFPAAVEGPLSPFQNLGIDAGGQGLPARGIAASVGANIASKGLAATFSMMAHNSSASFLTWVCWRCSASTAS